MIDPLAEHLAAVHRRGRIYMIGLVVLAASYVVASWASEWNTGVIVTGCIVLLVVTLLAYRIRHADALETDRLMNDLKGRHE